MLKRIHCLIAPHAGYDYSGAVAAHSYLRIMENQSNGSKVVVIILGPNHYGLGSGVALPQARSWSTPAGTIEIDREISSELARNSDILDWNDEAHSREHSIEVQIPFILFSLEHVQPLRFVPISMMLQDHDTSKDISEALLKILNSTEHKEDHFIIIASSDLNHYEAQEIADEKNQRLLDKVRQLDTGGFYNVLERYSVTSCGYGPIAVAMRVAKSCGSEKAEILRYATSGDTTGDYTSVVGYSAVELL